MNWTKILMGVLGFAGLVVFVLVMGWHYYNYVDTVCTEREDRIEREKETLELLRKAKE